MAAVTPPPSSARPIWHTRVRRELSGKSSQRTCVRLRPNTYDSINGLLMVAGIPQRPLSISALDILLGKYRIAGKSSGIPQNMAEAIRFSHDNMVKAHLTTHNSIQDIHKLIDLMDAGQTAGRFGIVLD